MPTSDIIGYLWMNRHSLDLDGIPDVLTMAGDLQRQGVEVARVEDIKILGRPAGVTVQLLRRDRDEWSTLVHEAILSASVADTINMTHEAGDDE